MTRHHIAMGIASAVVFVVAMVLFAIGPSEIEHAADVAADVADAIAQARAERRGEIHQAQALAMLAASGRN